jgi:hypothetical protein
MGNKAVKLVAEHESQSIEFPKVLKIAHPAYIRRFQNDAAGGWSKDLLEHLSPWGME